MRTLPLWAILLVFAVPSFRAVAWNLGRLLLIERWYFTAGVVALAALTAWLFG